MFSNVTDINEIVRIRDTYELVAPGWHAAEARLRELLTAKYGDESVLCIKTAFMPSYIKEGFTAAGGDKALANAKDLARLGEFIPRAYAEFNPVYKQIIPYVVAIAPSTNVFVMERIKGDSRLVGNLSLGIGGHINPIDADEDGSIIGAALYRELDEEVDVDSEGGIFDFSGFIYDPSNSVGRDHLGFVFTFYMKDENISIKEVDTLKGYLCPAPEVKERKEKMENWSKFVVDNLL